MADSTDVVSDLEQHENFIQSKEGWCFFSCPPGDCPIIFNLYVHPEYRRQGHAKRLLNIVITDIRHTGYLGDIYIEACPRESSITKDDLIKFYKSLGLTIPSPTVAGELLCRPSTRPR